MRPIVTSQNPLRYPLNELFGTEAHVRLIRVLATDVGGPVSSSDAAQRAGLTLRGAQKAFNRLVESGFVEKIGGGRRQQYTLRKSEKLVQTIINLFTMESNRYNELIQSIKKTIQLQQPAPVAVWLEELPVKTGDPLFLSVLHETRYIHEYIKLLRNDLQSIEKSYDLTIELKGYTKADMFDLNEEKIVPLYGILPLPNISSQKLVSHLETDRHIQALASRLASYIEKDPSVIHRAKEYVSHQLMHKQGPATPDIEEWRSILDAYSVHRLSRFLSSSSERATRLRQSCPLFAVLTAQERNHIFNKPGRNSDSRTT